MVYRQWTRRLRRRDYRRQLDSSLSRPADRAGRIAARPSAGTRESRCDPDRARSFLAAVHKPLEKRRHLSGRSCPHRQLSPRLLCAGMDLRDRRPPNRSAHLDGARRPHDICRLASAAGGRSARAWAVLAGDTAGNDRDQHGTTSVGGFAPEIRIEGERLLLTDAGLFSLIIRAPGGDIVARHDWYRDFDLPMEAERGLESTDSHLCIGEVTIPLIPGQWRGIVASLEPEPSVDLAAALRRRLDHDRAAVSTAVASSPAMRGAPGWIARLALAADTFLFSRPLPSVPDGQSVIAGYPWFGDWGRDTMISLPGLTLAAGRPDVARRILKTFASFVSEGMLPNMFPDAGDRPEYNTADASLWFFEAWRAYVDATGDITTLREVFPVLSDMIEWHQKGTRYGIGVDPADGLLKAGIAGVQLTWMDAKVGDWVVTPRIGKPVEVNALWYNALRIMGT